MHHRSSSLWRLSWIGAVLLATLLLVSLSVGAPPGAGQQQQQQQCSFDDGAWEAAERCEMPSPPHVLACNATLRQQWVWGRGDCAPRLGQDGLRRLFANRTVLFAGDSHARYVYSQLMQLMGGPPFIKWEHHAGRFEEGNITLRFVWAPTLPEVTAYMTIWEKQGIAPDIVAVSSGSWHVRNTEQKERQLPWFVANLQDLAAAAAAYQRRHDAAQQHITWLWLSASLRVAGRAKGPELVPEHLVSMFSQAAEGAGLLRAQGGLFHYLDLFTLSLGCWEWCSMDGTHLEPTANEVAALQAAHIFNFDQQKL